MGVQIDCLFPSPGSDLSDDALSELFGREDRSAAWLRVNFVSSVDGASTVDGLSGALGGEADHRVFDLLRELTDVVIVGAGTVRGEGYGPMVLPPASVERRVSRGLAPHPVFAIVSNRLDLDPSSRIFTEAPVRPIVVMTDAAPRDRRDALSAVADILIAGDSQLDPARLVAGLAERGLTQQHCEGGPSLFGALLAAGAVDELCLTVSPQLVAGEAGRIITGDLSSPRDLALGHVLASGDTLLLRYELR
ncbi:pyrimidine reductase family protein [Glaciihabitans sp. INWT7]|uniref:pyrimidine reductase family protein n=1 Tax=Glaciihabitans sp. INWT7 TaxID=2596912 RepID=UPI0016288F7F|nr:pyrimidine reductase family protein [Glaciihabitans sp. INWT7]QNE47784.1 pyrimidine reductase family protein [Glaciihabitans sp. INWT7]